MRAGAGGRKGAGAGAGADEDEDEEYAGALIPYAAAGGGAEEGGGGGVFANVPARPIAITKHGVRQFVETTHGVRLFLQNCVSSSDLRCTPDLAYIATHARNAEYNPQRFAAVIIRLREPKATALVFRSGKMVVTGAKSEEDSLLAARTIGKILLVRRDYGACARHTVPHRFESHSRPLPTLQKLGFSSSIASFRIQNIVATGDCGFPIRLEGLADEESKFSSFEPELFPGLIYRMEVPKVVILVFVSGKIVVTGAKSRTALFDGVNKLYPLLFKYRKTVTSAAVDI
jgi:transcription initiation factor TFIID TATA-box-binding protein